MNERKQRRRGRLLVLLSVAGLIVVLPCLIVWWEMRQERLSAQLLATVRSVQVRSEDRFSEDQKAEREQARQQARKDEATVARLLQEGADPNVRDVPVVKRTFWEEVKLLLKRALKPPPDPASLPPSALALAVQSKDAVIVTELLNRGATDVNAEFETRNRLERFPLVNYAACIGNLEMVRALCAHGADIHQLGHDRGYGITILQYALVIEDAYTDSGTLKKDMGMSLESKNRTEIFQMLLAKGAKYGPNSQVGFGLLCTATASDLLEPTRALLAAGVPVNAKPSRLEVGTYDTPLDNGVANDDLTLVKLLLLYGAQTRDTHSEAPILLVRSPEMARLLMEHGADIHAVSKRGKRAGENALNFAAIRGDAKVALFLIQNGFDVNAGTEGWSPIEEAAEYGNVETVRLLLQHGAKVGPNSPGADALWLAIAEQHFDSAKLLLRYGAAVNPKPSRLTGETEYPLEEAANQDDPEMARALLKWGANPNADSGAALLEACANCDEDLVEVLLEYGADPTVRSGDGMTAIQTVRQNANPPSDADGIVALLKDYGAQR